MLYSCRLPTSHMGTVGVKLRILLTELRMAERYCDPLLLVV